MADIQTSQHPNPKRRGMIKGLVGVSFTAVIAPVFYAVGRYLGFSGGASGSKEASVAASEITAEHPSKLVNINDEPVLIIYQPDHGIRAFDAKCTHLGCTVSYKPEMPGFFCKCHKGVYDANGVNAPGSRPKRPLTELTVEQKDDQLTVTLTPKKAS